MPTYNSNVLPQSLFVSSQTIVVESKDQFGVIPMICTDSPVLPDSDYQFNNHHYIVINKGQYLNVLENMFGKNSDIYKFVNNIMLQKRNFTKNEVQALVIGNLNGTSGTRGYFETSYITPEQIAAFALVSQNGAFDIAIDGGTAKKVKNFKGTGVTTIEKLKEAFDNLSLGVDIEIITDSTGSKLRFYSKTIGDTSSVVITAATATGTITDITTSDYLDIENGNAVTGADASGDRDEADLIDEIRHYAYFNICTTTREIDVRGTAVSNANSMLKVLRTLEQAYLSADNFRALFIGTVSSLQDAKDVKQYIYNNGDSFQSQYMIDVSCANLDKSNSMLFRATIFGLATGTDISKGKMKWSLNCAELKNVDVSSAQWDTATAAEIQACGVHVVAKIIGNNMILDKQNGYTPNTEDKVNAMIIDRSLVWDLIINLNERGGYNKTRSDIDALKNFIASKLDVYYDGRVLAPYNEEDDGAVDGFEYLDEVSNTFTKKGYGVYIPYKFVGYTAPVSILLKLASGIVSIALNFVIKKV